MLAGSWKLSFALPSKHPDAEGNLRSLPPPRSAGGFLTTHSRNGITHSDILLLLSSYHQHLQIKLWAWSGLSVKPDCFIARAQVQLILLPTTSTPPPALWALTVPEQGSPSLGQGNHIWQQEKKEWAGEEAKGKLCLLFPAGNLRHSKQSRTKSLKSVGSIWWRGC